LPFFRDGRAPQLAQVLDGDKTVLADLFLFQQASVELTPHLKQAREAAPQATLQIKVLGIVERNCSAKAIFPRHCEERSSLP
jgi:hypothetical protein